MLDCCSSYIVIRCYAAEDALVIAGCSRKVSLLRKTYNLISEWERCEFAGETLKKVIGHILNVFAVKLLPRARCFSWTELDL